MTKILNATTFELELSGKDKVEVGDMASTEFKPHVKLNRWDGECCIKIQMAGDIEGEVEYQVEDGKVKAKYKIKFGKFKQEVETEFYSLEPTEQHELGGFEFEVILKEKPATNKIVLDIETEGLEFCYQPPLHPDHPTWKDDEVGHHYRPENIVGSYAVYHATKGRMVDSTGRNYKTGIAFHIYRPRIEDANGNRVWGELHHDRQARTLTTTIPQDFLDAAAYPVRHAAGEQFGYTDVGGTSTTIGTDTYLGMPGTPLAGTAQSISIYTKDSGARIKGVLLLGADKNILANGVGDIAICGVSPDWVISPFGTDPTLVNAEHFAGVVNEANNDLYYNSGAGNQRWQDSSNSFASPTNPTDGTQSSTRYSIYATYTPSPTGWAGGDVSEVPIANIAKINGVALADILKVSGVA